MLLKRTLFGVFGVMQCVYAVRGKKNIFFHILYIIVALLCSIFLKCVYLNKACMLWLYALNGQLSGALWLADYLKRVTDEGVAQS